MQPSRPPVRLPRPLLTEKISSDNILCNERKPFGAFFFFGGFFFSFVFALCFSHRFLNHRMTIRQISSSAASLYDMPSPFFFTSCCPLLAVIPARKILGIYADY